MIPHTLMKGLLMLLAWHFHLLFSSDIVVVTKKIYSCFCTQVYPDPSGWRQWEVQSDYVVLGGGAWHLHPQPCRLSLFSEGAVRHTEGDLVCMAWWVGWRDPTYAADGKCTVLHWWGHLHQWWAYLRHIHEQIVGTILECTQLYRIMCNVLTLEDLFQAYNAWHSMSEESPPLGHRMAVVSTGIELKQEIHWLAESLNIELLLQSYAPSSLGGWCALGTVSLLDTPFFVNIPFLWNTIPYGIVNSTSYAAFKYKLKSFFF